MTDAELVALGLLHEGAEYVYEIEQRVRQRNLREWAAIGFSSLYYLLHRAEKRGWVRSREGAGRRGPATRKYRLTEAGLKELRQAILARFEAPSSAVNVELGVMFAGAISPEEFVTALRSYAEKARTAAVETRQRWEQVPDTPYRATVDAIFDHSVMYLEGEAAWAERTLARGQGSGVRGQESETT